jgi:hypothetical protein
MPNHWYKLSANDYSKIPISEVILTLPEFIKSKIDLLGKKSLYYRTSLYRMSILIDYKKTYERLLKLHRQFLEKNKITSETSDTQEIPKTQETPKTQEIPKTQETSETI